MRKINGTPERRYPEKSRDRHRYADETAVSNALIALRDEHGFYNSDMLDALLKHLSRFIDNEAVIDGRTVKGKDLTATFEAITEARRKVAHYFRSHRPDA